MLRFTFILIFSFCNFVYSQTDKLKETLCRGDLSYVFSILDEKVEISLLEKDYFSTKEESIVILSDYFKKDSIKKFTYLHSGQSSTSYYFIGCFVLLSGEYDLNLLINNGKIYSFRLDLS